MSAAIVAAAGISVLAVFFFLVESEGLSDAHARVRTQVFNAARWAFVIALTWVLIPVAFSESGPQRGLTILGMVALEYFFCLINGFAGSRMYGNQRASARDFSFIAFGFILRDTQPD